MSEMSAGENASRWVLMDRQNVGTAAVRSIFMGEKGILTVTSEVIEIPVRHHDPIADEVGEFDG